MLHPLSWKHSEMKYGYGQTHSALCVHFMCFVLKKHSQSRNKHAFDSLRLELNLKSEEGNLFITAGRIGCSYLCRGPQKKKYMSRTVSETVSLT
jgi:hypothetical protein